MSWDRKRSIVAAVSFLAAGAALTTLVFAASHMSTSAPAAATAATAHAAVAGQIDGTWAPVSSVGAPSPRGQFAAVWTGDAFLVWGGQGRGGDPAYGGYLNDGGRYDPVADTWAPLATAGAPSPRASGATWTGSELFVWGGVTRTGAVLGDGGRYDPATDSWTAMSAAGAPAPRVGNVAVWTGSEVLVWGGFSGTEVFADGGRYDPAADRWTPMAPAAGLGLDPQRSQAVWTGAELLVWSTRAGARYDPATDTWAPLSDRGAPSLRTAPSVAWTGGELLVWGGFGCCSSTDVYRSFTDGARYDPASDTWTPMATLGAPSARSAPGVWTGRELLVWGGGAGPVTLFDGARYEPATDTWQPMAAAGAPQLSRLHAAVWTGQELLVWGQAPAPTAAPGVPAPFEAAGARYVPPALAAAPRDAESHALLTDAAAAPAATQPSGAAAAPAAQPTRAGATPATTTALYSDPNISFRYPANWSVEAPKTPPTDPAQGYSLRIRNYTEGDTGLKGALGPDKIKIELNVLPELGGYQDLDDWVTRRGLFAPGTTVSDMRHLTIGGAPAIRWVAQGPTTPEGAVVVAIGRGNRVYLLTVYPGTTRHIAAFDAILATWQFS